MNVVRQMRMKNLLSYEKLLAVPRLTTPDSMSITLYNSKIDFQDFLRPYYINVSQEWVKSMRIVSKYTSSRPEELYGNHSENVR